jgi:hypothetical protein
VTLGWVVGADVSGPLHIIANRTTTIATATATAALRRQ